MTTYLVTPEIGVPIQTSFSEDEAQYVLERTKLAFQTKQFQLINGLIPYDKTDPEHKELIRSALTQAGFAPQAKTKLPTNEEVQRWIEDIFLNHTSELVEDTTRMRNYVKTRLFLESNGDKGSERIKALESLGKMSDLGMFSDRVEVSIENRSTAEIEQELNDRLAKYMGKAQLVSQPKKFNRQAMVIDLDKELGLGKENSTDE